MLCAKFTDNEFSIHHFAHDTNEQNEEDDNDDTSRITNNNSTDGTFHISILMIRKMLKIPHADLSNTHVHCKHT